METSPQVPANQPRTFQNVTAFINHEATAGFVLAMAAIAAIIFDNTAALAPYYESLLATPIKVQIGNLLLAKPLILWVNDGLMAIFFFLVGLEIKREVMAGHLSSADQLVLPGFAAVRLGVIAGSLFSAVVGYLILRFARPSRANKS